MPAQTAANTYTVQMMVFARTPASLEASGFTPTASISMPSAVLRVVSATSPSTARLIRIEIGRIRNPAPTCRNGSLLTVMIWPSVTSMAMPRPAVISTSVAMIGWMPRPATRKPFQRPRIAQSTSAIAIPANAVPASPDVPMWTHVTAPAMAATAPTDRSMPRVAMTRVMPSAMRSVGAPFLSTSTRPP